MFKVEYSSWLKWEIEIWWSKNAALPILAANLIVNENHFIKNLPNIIDVEVLLKIFKKSKQISKSYFDLTIDDVKKLRASILLIPYWLLKYWEVLFIWSWWCNIWKRSLDTFDNAFVQAWVQVDIWDKKKYKVIWKPKKNIMLDEFSVTTTESLITYLCFANNYEYEINIYQIAIEPHVINTIEFLRKLWKKIVLNYDHSITIFPWLNINSEFNEFELINDYIQAWTYFAIWAWADDSEIMIKNINVDDLSNVYSISKKIWINFKVIDKKNILVNSYNKKNYQWTKLETRIYPWFPTDLQSIFWTLLTQANWKSKIFETMFEWRFWYLTELENLWANIEILNPNQALIIWPEKLKWWYVSSKDLRWWWAMILAWIMASWQTFITNEEIILRWYENILENLQSIWVKIEKN